MSNSTIPRDNLQTDVEEQVVLVLVGLIGSGKSTFAQALEQHFPAQFRRCNQDDLGNRSRVEALARRTLREGSSVCIDRTNFNAAQRSHWINIAREFPGTAVWVIVFQTPYEVCAARLRERTSHPTITSPEHGLSVLARFANEFEDPSAHEGYDRLIALRPSDHPSSIYTHADITSILQRLRDATPLTSLVTTDTNSWRRGNSSFRGDRVRGVNNRRLNGVPRARRASSYPINSRLGERGSSFEYGSVIPGGFDRVGSTAKRTNNHQRGTESGRSFRGGTSDSPNWRGSGSAEDPLTIT